jgi:hypothetical protein
MPSVSSSSTIFSGRTESCTAVPSATPSGTRAAHCAPFASRTPPSATSPSIRFEMPMKPATNGFSGRS